MAEKKKEMKDKKTKALDKWTVKELREEALQIPGVQGVHGMNKEELIRILKEHKGIADTGAKKKSTSVRELKAKVGELKRIKEEERGQGAARKRLDALRRKISRLKKKTRQ
ncbi:MAG: transcription termination factor Rho [Deltaproteobacteria bacterium]|nr:transcription termination factor Rho [Deltaproteobacteria bacterium]